MIGEATLFTRSDEVEAAWRVIDPLIAYWANRRPDHFPNYAAGSWGPTEADELIARKARGGESGKGRARTAVYFAMLGPWRSSNLPYGVREPGRSGRVSKETSGLSDPPLPLLGSSRRRPVGVNQDFS